MPFELSTESGRIHVHRVGENAIPENLQGRSHPRDTYTNNDPRYVVQFVDHEVSGSGRTYAILADRLNVNGSTFAIAEGHAEFGAGGHKRVYRDPSDPELVRVVVSPDRVQ